MLGWWIVVSMQSPEERDRADQDTRRAAILANWEASVNGSRWVPLLVEQGKASQLSSGGYPQSLHCQGLRRFPAVHQQSAQARWPDSHWR